MGLHPGAQWRQLPTAGVVVVQFDVLDDAAALRVGVQSLDLSHERDVLVLLDLPGQGTAGGQLVPGQPVVEVLAECLRHVEVADLGSVAVDLERVDAAIEVGVHTEDEVAVDIESGIPRQDDVAPVEATDPVERVLLGIRLGHDLFWECQAPVHERAVDGAGECPTAPVDEAQDRVVRLCRPDSRAVDGTAGGALLAIRLNTSAASRLFRR